MLSHVLLRGHEHSKRNQIHPNATDLEILADQQPSYMMSMVSMANLGTVSLAKLHKRNEFKLHNSSS